MLLLQLADANPERPEYGLALVELMLKKLRYARNFFSISSTLSLIHIFPGGTLLSMPAGGKLIQTMPGGERRETVFNGRLPEETGYVEIFPPGEGKTPLFQGSVWFSDARMGDFSHCSTFDTGLPQPPEEALRHLKRDPLAPLWLALAFLALILSWLPPVPDTSLRP